MTAARLYRKRPAIIEAMRLPAREDWEGWWDFVDWIGIGDKWEVAEDYGLDIHTLEGMMHACPGDWIIKGVMGELYPLKPDVFERTYEPIAKVDA